MILIEGLGVLFNFNFIQCRPEATSAAKNASKNPSTRPRTVSVLIYITYRLVYLVQS